MKKLLYINACVRKESRTDFLSRKVLEKALNQANDAGHEVTIKELYIGNMDLQPLTKERLEKRTELGNCGDFSDPMFDLAKEFAQADEIVVGAPYWDLSFPASLKVYIENICVTGITFKYTEEGYPVGLCKGKKLTYVTTAGGNIGQFNFGYDYVKTIAQGMFGIGEVEFVKAEGLDIFGADVEGILEEAVKTCI